MSGPLANDDELTAALQAALEEHDPIPEAALGFARSAHRLVQFESELAEMVEESMESEALATRSERDVRLVRFEIRDIEIELEISGEHASGTVVPACDELTVATSVSRQQLDVTPRGVFRFDVPAEPFRIECRIHDLWIRTDLIAT